VLVALVALSPLVLVALVALSPLVLVALVALSPLVLVALVALSPLVLVALVALSPLVLVALVAAPLVVSPALPLAGVLGLAPPQAERPRASARTPAPIIDRFIKTSITSFCAARGACGRRGEGLAREGRPG
jgi:hypothetical protein